MQAMCLPFRYNYTGKLSVQRVVPRGVTHRVVMDLVDPYLGKATGCSQTTIILVLHFSRPSKTQYLCNWYCKT